MRRGVVLLCCEDKMTYRQAYLAVRTGLGKASVRQQRALFFVVRSVRIVDGIMEPYRQFDGDRLRGKMASRIELRQAFRNVTRIVVVAMGFRVAALQDIKPRAPVAATGSITPEADPRVPA